MNHPISLKNIYRVQLAIVTVTAFALVLLQGAKPAMGFLAGACLITLNFLLLHLVWSRVWNKKPVATTFAIIVFKYAVLGLILYYLVKVLGFDLTSLMVGIGSIIGSFLVVAVQAQISC